MPRKKPEKISNKFGVSADEVEKHSYIPLDIWEKLPAEFKKELMTKGWVAGVPPTVEKQNPINE